MSEQVRKVVVSLAFLKDAELKGSHVKRVLSLLKALCFCHPKKRGRYGIKYRKAILLDSFLPPIFPQKQEQNYKQ